MTTFKAIASKDWTVRPNKSLEIELYYYSGGVFQLEMGSHRMLHPGWFFTLGILGLHFGMTYYDHRHCPDVREAAA